jgi:HKD family nuclease
MIKLVIENRRPSTDIPYYTRPVLVSDLLNLQKATGKFITESRNLSEDGLVFTYEGIWDTIEDYNQFVTHAAVIEYTNERIAYNLENGITISTKILDYMSQ